MRMNAFVPSVGRIVYTLALLITTFPASEVLCQRVIHVSGRVIDNEGKPITKAQVSLLPPHCDSCIDYTFPVYETSEHGFFELSLDLDKKVNVRLFVEREPPSGLWNPIFPADLTLAKIARFRGKQINTAASKTIRVGDVRPTIQYKKVSIPIHSLVSGPSSENDFVNTAKLTIKYNKLRIVDRVPIPSKAYKDGLINLTLPEGSWDLTFSFSVGANKRNISLRR